jgi:hypothetical protein
MKKNIYHRDTETQREERKQRTKKKRKLFFSVPLCLCGGLFLVLAGLCSPAHALDRSAFTFTRYDLHARVVPVQQGLEVQGRITLRNDSPSPQRAVALQISSTLGWQSIQLGGKPLTFIADRYTTDIDHTGGVTEAVFTLPNPVPPKGTVELEIAYAGTVPDTRLEENGVPVGATAHSDWDQIGSSFTAVRGIGYVCWYPVALDAISLADGAQFFHALGEWKARHAASVMHLSLALLGDKPVVTNGRLMGQNASADPEGTLQEREYDFSPMGIIPPTFAIGDYTVLARPAMNVFYLPGHQTGAQEYTAAAENIGPFLADWLGPQREKVNVVDLPTGDAPFDSGTLLFTPLTPQGRESAEVAVAHQMAHASVGGAPSREGAGEGAPGSRPCCSGANLGRLWVAEGIAHFAQALVRERQNGRKAALDYMQDFRPALVEAEKQARTGGVSSSKPGPTSAGEPLVTTSDEIYYRTKAMFVWWMLRDMLGDKALQQALHAYRAADDNDPAYVQHLLEVQSKAPLGWFFKDWVYGDAGLPDFRIETAYPRQLLPNSYTTTVTVENLGDAAAEVPVLIPLQNGEARERVTVTAHGKAVTHVQSPEAPTQVVVNDGSVPESDVSNNTFKVTGNSK